MNTPSTRLVAAASAALLLAVAAPTAGFATDTVTINKAGVDQQIYGFGATAGRPIYDLINTVSGQSMSSASQTALTKFLFDPTSGLGLSILRLQINPFQATDSQILHKEQATFEPSNGTWNFGTGYTDGGIFTKAIDGHQKWIANQAIGYNVSRFYSLPWSPPKWMKANGNEVGGAIDTSKYDAFATYLEAYVLDYGNVEGIPIQWLGLQNEPNIEASYASCTYSPTTVSGTWPPLNDLINNVVPHLKTYQLPSLIVGPEASNTTDSINYLNAMSSATMGRLDVMSSHDYGTYNPSFLSNQYSGQPGVRWMTEDTDGSTPEQNDITDALQWAEEVRTWMEGGASAFTYWYALDDDSSDHETCLVHFNPSSTGGNYTKTLRAYAIGQFSRFIRPGYFRIDSTVTPSTSSLLASSYLDKGTNKSVTVVINPGAAVSGKVSGLNASKVFVYETSSTDSLTQWQNELTVANSAVTLTFDANSITTLVEDYAPSATAPGEITTLAASNVTSDPNWPASFGKCVLLQWTAKGANNFTGMANHVVIKYAFNTAFNSWTQSGLTTVAGTPPGLSSGAAQSFVVTGLSHGTYHFAAKAFNEDGLSSAFQTSDVATVTVP